MTIQLDSKFDKASNSTLIVAIEGTPEEIRTQLFRLATEMKSGKPGQGVFIGAEYTTQIITPVWNGKKC